MLTKLAVHVAEAAGVAASRLPFAMNILRFLQDDPPPEDNGFWEITKRILSALADIMSHWKPGELPITPKDILIKLFREQTIERVGPKLDTVINNLIEVPALNNDIWIGISILFIVPAFLLVIYNSFIKSSGYWKTFNRIGAKCQKIESYTELDLVHSDDHPDIVSPQRWLGRSAAVIAFIIIWVTGLGFFIQAIWAGTVAIARAFYTGQETTFGKLTVDVFLMMIPDTNPLDFIGTLTAVMILMTVAVLVFFIRYLGFVWQNPVLIVEIPQICTGRWDDTIDEAVAKYVAELGKVMLTMLIILISPLIILDIFNLSGFFAVAGLYAFAWFLVFQLPKIFEKTQVQKHLERLRSAINGTPPRDIEVIPVKEEPEPIRRAKAWGKRASKQFIHAADKAFQLKYPQYGAFRKTTDTIIGGDAGGLVFDTINRSWERSHDPDKKILDSMPDWLYQERDELNNDRDLNDAVFCKIAITYANEVPLQTRDELISSMTATMKKLQADNNQDFNRYAKRGGELKQKSELWKKR